MRKAGLEISVTLVLGLTALWLLLNQTMSPAQIALGLALGTLLSWSSSRLRPLHARVRRLDCAAMLVLTVAADIIRANLSVARFVLVGPRNRNSRPGFVRIPLDLRDAHGLAALAAIITSTPGTVWAGLSADGRALTLHVLDLEDEAAVIGLIKSRYEAPLMRIFE